MLTSYVKDAFSRNMELEFEMYEEFYSSFGFRKYAERLECFPYEPEDWLGPLVEHIFIFISTDRAPAFRSSTKRLWPVLAFIGYITGRSILPVMCLPGNPTNLESFLSPCFEELESLRNGVGSRLRNDQFVLVKCHLMDE